MMTYCNYYSDLGTYDDFDPLFDGELLQEGGYHDKDGNELATQIVHSSMSSEIAFGMRTAAIDVDNLLWQIWNLKNKYIIDFKGL